MIYNYIIEVLTTMRCLYFTEARFDIINRSEIACKLLQYLNDLFSDYSTCLILAFTVERYLAAYQPMRFKRVSACTRTQRTHNQGRRHQKGRGGGVRHLHLFQTIVFLLY